MKRITILKTDGTHETRQVDKTDLKMLQKAVGGLIETIPYLGKFEGKACEAYCNEEGLLDGLPFNGPATNLWLENLKGKGELAHYPKLFGDIVIIQNVLKKAA